MLRNILGSISGANLPSVDAKDAHTDAAKAPASKPPSRIIDRTAEVVKFISVFKVNVSVDASQFKADEMRKLIATARQYGVMVSLRNLQLNPQILANVIGSDGKNVMVEM